MKNSKRLYALLCAAALLIGGTLTACGKPSADPSTDGGTRYLPGEPEKGAVYAKATKPDFIAYTVTEFQGDAAAEITFTQPTDQNGTGYVFQGEELSRTAWEKAAKPYLALIAGQTADNVWHSYTPKPVRKSSF